MSNYPKPDYAHFAKGICSMAICLLVLHWTPEIATWIHAEFFNETLLVDQRRYHMVLVVAYVLMGGAALFYLAALLWATWHHQRRKK